MQTRLFLEIHRTENTSLFSSGKFQRQICKHISPEDRPKPNMLTRFSLENATDGYANQTLSGKFIGENMQACFYLEKFQTQICKPISPENPPLTDMLTRFSLDQYAKQTLSGKFIGENMQACFYLEKFQRQICNPDFSGNFHHGQICKRKSGKFRRRGTFCECKISF